MTVVWTEPPSASSGPSLARLTKFGRSLEASYQNMQAATGQGTISMSNLPDPRPPSSLRLFPYDPELGRAPALVFSLGDGTQAEPPYIYQEPPNVPVVPPGTSLTEMLRSVAAQPTERASVSRLLDNIEGTAASYPLGDQTFGRRLLPRSNPVPDVVEYRWTDWEDGKPQTDQVADTAAVVSWARKTVGVARTATPTDEDPVVGVGVDGAFIRLRELEQNPDLEVRFQGIAIPTVQYTEGYQWLAPDIAVTKELAEQLAGTWQYQMGQIQEAVGKVAAVTGEAFEQVAQSIDQVARTTTASFQEIAERFREQLRTPELEELLRQMGDYAGQQGKEYDPDAREIIELPRGWERAPRNTTRPFTTVQARRTADRARARSSRMRTQRC